ncbi:MAG: serine--tRNA ligase [Alphaproteobacteria bacterium]|nr:serine--tRNA ligase [Alphaproteobacteria bacterium]
MHDIRYIRENPKAFDKAMFRRGLDSQSSALIKLDEERRAVQTELQKVQAERNEKSKMIGKVKSQGGDAQSIMDEVSAMKSHMAGLEERERNLLQVISQHLAALPNIMSEDVPDGENDDDNIEVRKVGEVKVKSGSDHVEIGEGLDMLDFEIAAKMSGSRFVLLHSGLARMERALAQFMLDTHTQEHGYTEVSPPLIVRDNALFGTGQLPKFAEDLFRIPESSVELEEKVESSRWLIPTAEVPLTNIVADAIVNEECLPRRYCAFTSCFRSEAGSAGKDTRGMLRQHQFYKVEMVSVSTPENSQEEHERMTGCAETILKKLDLPFRTVILCSGDTGFGAQKTYDLEVWLPGQETYREISSCSNCGDFQARRMNARSRRKGEKKTRFVHTLNGSGLAVGRSLIAVMENYYDPVDGGVFVPDVLKPYMGGLEKIMKVDIDMEKIV